MHTLTPPQILTLYEQSAQLSAIQRSDILLTMALPTLTIYQIDTLTVGERNQHLLNIRAALFGNNMDCIGSCPNCQENIE